MLMAYASVAAFFLVALGFMLVSLAVGRLVRPNRPYAGKVATYECGEEPDGPAWFNYNPRFYVVALIYIVFDVEIAFVYPVASVFRRWVDQAVPGGPRTDLTAFLEIAVFVGILLVGLAYVWAKGDLAWIRAIKAEAPALALARRDVERATEPAQRGSLGGAE